MREDWQTVKLGDVLKTSSGGTPTRSRKEYYEGGKIPWLMSGEVAQGNVYEAKKFITVEGLKNSSAKMFPPETVLVAMYGATAGQVGILRVESTTNQAVCGIFPSQEYVPEFLYYSILQQQKDLIKAATGNAQPNISQTKIKDIQIPLPPLPEQERIVSILDKAFEGIDKAIAQTEQNLASARELFESYLNTIFTQKGEDWVEKKLGDACIVERGSSPRPIKQYLTEDESGVNWVKIGDTQGIEKTIRNTRQKITPEGATKSRKVNCGDFILTNSMTYGKPYIMGIEGYIHDGWFVLRLGDEVLTEYFYYLLSSNYVQEQFQNLAAGAVVKNISSALVKKALLPIPPLSEQKNAVITLNDLKQQTIDLEALYTQKLSDLKELKQSLLQQAFAGELTKEDAA